MVFPFLGPFNPDSQGHLEYILYLKHYWSLPPSNLGHETWQPPFYYIITAAVAEITENPKALQGVSLLTSIATLCLFYKLLATRLFISTDEGRYIAMSFLAILPQFVMFSLYISNDSMATLCGALSFFLAAQLLKVPSIKRFIALCSGLAIGLLTKGQFIVIAPILFCWGCYLIWRTIAHRRIWTLVVAFGFLILILGSAKYVLNASTYGNPFISNLNFNHVWIKQQQGTYLGLYSLLDCNVFKLLRKPTLDESTKHSIPLMLYGTFWYQWIPESNFRGNSLPLTSWIGRYMDCLGILPTAISVLGIFVFSRKLWCSNGECPFVEPSGLLKGAAVLTFVGNLLILLRTFFQTDVWSVLQARSLFPSILGALVVCDQGLSCFAFRIRASRTITYWRLLFVVGAVSYFVSEIVLQLVSAIGGN